jgi:hypothetical protein
VVVVVDPAGAVGCCGDDEVDAALVEEDDFAGTRVKRTASEGIPDVQPLV